MDRKKLDARQNCSTEDDSLLQTSEFTDYRDSRVILLFLLNPLISVTKDQ